MNSFLRVLFCAALIIGVAGCASILRKEEFDFKTTALFVKPCKELERAEKPYTKKKEGFWAKLNPAQLFRQSNTEKAAELKTTVNDCVAPDIERMVETFKSIKETDEKRGALGDTRQEVRQKGFTIYTDATERVQRPNTRALYGNEALAAVGMSVSPPPLQTPEEVKAYIQFMNGFYGEQYDERGLKKVVDRVCINNDESLDIGDDYSFVIVWQEDHVFRRVIKGGPVNNPKKDSGFFLCPGSFVGDLLKGGVSRGVGSVLP